MKPETQSSSLDRVADYWSKIRFSRELHHYERVWWAAVRNIAATCSKILEIGAGDGRFLDLLKKESPARFYALDITQTVALLRNRADCIVGDSRHLPFEDGVFDLAYSLGVVEHFPETGLAVAEHARVVRPGGYVIVTTPRLGLFTLKRLLSFYAVRRRFRFGTFETIQGRNLRLNTMRRMFRESGLDVVESGASGFYTLRGYRRFPIAPIDRALGAYLYCIGRKREQSAV